jgi:hypothetical protein
MAQGKQGNAKQKTGQGQRKEDVGTDSEWYGEARLKKKDHHACHHFVCT